MITHQLVDIGGLLTRPPMSTLFTIDPSVRNDISASMSANGFDESKPIDVWNDGGGLVVIDGHTRLSVARELGIVNVPIFEHEFDNQLAALRYAFHNQKNRRNLQGLGLVRAIEIVDAEYRQSLGGQLNPYGRAGRPVEMGVSTETPIYKSSAEDTAAIVGTSSGTVKRARVVYDDPLAMEEVEQGVSITAAAERSLERQGRKREPRESPSNGHTGDLPGANTDWSTVARPTIDETTPTFRAREHGGMCLSNAERLEMVVAERIALAVDQGIDLREIVANDRDVRKVWREAAQAALRAYKAIRSISGEWSH